MSVNSTSTSSYLSLYLCTGDKVNLFMTNFLSALRILLLLPLSTFVLYLGHQRWRSSKTTTHSDIFTYHVAAMQLIAVSGSFLVFGGLYANNLVILNTGIYTIFSTLSGETVFHVLTCVERYLAVVHPITYMGLRNARGVRIRNICIGSVWLLSFGVAAVAVVYASNYNTIPSLCFLVFSITVISFCSLSVLWVLIRPGPGEGGREKERVDQSKQRAFYTITAISVTVWVWFVGLLVSTAVSMSPLQTTRVGCLLATSVGWLNLPSSLVSPLLYLHRTRKLPYCC